MGRVTVLHSARPPTEDDLLARLPDHDALVCMLTDPVTSAVIAAATAPGLERPLRIISQIAVGLDNVDVEAARAAGVIVCHTPGVLTDATADLTMALLLALSRRVVEADALVRRGEWGLWSLPWMTGLELRGAVLGIFGMGRIGTAVAHRARAFGMRVIYCNRSPARAAVELNAERVDFETLLRTSDVISIHAPATPATRHRFDAHALSRMKPGSRLVNTARGSLVDEEALAEALETGPLVGVGLDVYEREPHVPASLLGRPDVILLPHIGSATEATRRRMSELAVTSVEQWAEGFEPTNRFGG
jgi:glyoxylate reductase